MEGGDGLRVHVLEAVEVARAVLKARVAPGVARPHGREALAGDERRREPRPGAVRRQRPVDVEAEVVHLGPRPPREVHRAVRRPRRRTTSASPRWSRRPRRSQNSDVLPGVGAGGPVGALRRRGRDHVAGVSREAVVVERGPSARVGDDDRAREDLALAVAARIRPGRVLEELDPVRAGGSVERRSSPTTCRAVSTAARRIGEVQAARSGRRRRRDGGRSGSRRRRRGRFPGRRCSRSGSASASRSRRCRGCGRRRDR